MKAIDVIEAESPKKFFDGRDSGYKQACSMKRMGRFLEPLGFTFQVAPGGGYWWKDKGGMHYAVWLNGCGADIQIYRWIRDHIQHTETVPVSSFYYLKTHVRMFGLDQPVAESALTLDPHGGVRFDPRPKMPRSIWTHQRMDPDDNPKPYHQRRQMEDGHVLDIIAAFRRKDAPMELLQAVKGYGPEVAKAAKMGADHVAWELMSMVPIHIVMPLPSSQPLARRFARLIANETYAELEDNLAKTKSVRVVPIAHRRAAALNAYSAQGRYRGKTIVIVDDYVVTSSSMQAAATRLYQAGAKRVIGVALAI